MKKSHISADIGVNILRKDSMGYTTHRGVIFMGVVYSDVRRHYMGTELHKLLESYPTTVNHTDIVDFDNFDERLSAIDTLVVNTVGVLEDVIEFIPDHAPPLKEEIYCWIWAIRPDLSKDLLDLDITEDFRILLKSYIENDMRRFWNHIS